MLKCREKLCLASILVESLSNAYSQVAHYDLSVQPQAPGFIELLTGWIVCMSQARTEPLPVTQLHWKI